MTLQLDSTSVKKLKLIKKLALQLGVNVLETPEEVVITITSEILKNTRTKQDLTEKEKKWIANLKQSKIEIQDHISGKKKMQTLNSFFN